MESTMGAPTDSISLPTGAVPIRLSTCFSGSIVITSLI